MQTSSMGRHFQADLVLALLVEVWQGKHCFWDLQSHLLVSDGMLPSDSVLNISAHNRSAMSCMAHCVKQQHEAATQSGNRRCRHKWHRKARSKSMLQIHQGLSQQLPPGLFACVKKKTDKTGTTGARTRTEQLVKGSRFIHAFIL